MRIILATLEVKAGRLKVQGLPVLHNKFKSYLGHYGHCLKIKTKKGLECSSVTEHLPSISKALGSIPSNTHTYTHTHTHTHTHTFTNTHNA
jgi:hypothetical protein